MKRLSFITADEAFRFNGRLANTLPGVYVMVNLQRCIQRAKSDGHGNYIPDSTDQAREFSGDQAETWVDVVGTAVKAA